MATSQLGKRCKSKHEGDIRGVSDRERRGGQRRGTVDEDKEERRRRWMEGAEAWSLVHFHFTC